jgi:type IV pilus assembly protein PilN
MILINLLPIKQLQAEVTRRREIIIGSVVLGTALLVLLGTYLYQSYQLTQRENELAQLRTELQALNAKVKEVADLQTRIKDLRGKQKIIEDLNNKKTGPVRVMESLSLATPATLWLTDLRDVGGILSLNGLAIDNETVANFMRSLAESKHFTHVEVVETIQGTGPLSAFKKFAIQARIIHRPPGDSPTGAKTKVSAPAAKEEKKS